MASTLVFNVSTQITFRHSQIEFVEIADFKSVRNLI